MSIAATGTPQPLIGTKLTGAVAPSDAPVTVAVADSGNFEVGDTVNLYDNAGGYPAATETLYIDAIPDATHVVVSLPQGQGVRGSYSTSGWLVLNVRANHLYIQSKVGNAASIWVGSDARMSSATGAYAIAELSAVTAGQPIEFTLQETVGRFPETPANLWVEGTAGDKFLVVLGML